MPKPASLYDSVCLTAAIHLLRYTHLKKRENGIVLSALQNYDYSPFNNDILIALHKLCPNSIDDVNVLHLISPTVKILDLSRCNNLSLPILKKTFEKCKKLQFLNFSFCDQRIVSSFLQLSSLTNLNLEQNYKLTDSDVQSILLNLKNLSSLNVECCVLLTNYSFDIPQKQPYSIRLSAIYLSYCDNITNEGIYSLTELCGPTLKIIAINNIPIDFSAFLYIAGYSLDFVARMKEMAADMEIINSDLEKISTPIDIKKILLPILWNMLSKNFTRNNITSTEEYSMMDNIVLLDIESDKPDEEEWEYEGKHYISMEPCCRFNEYQCEYYQQNCKYKEQECDFYEEYSESNEENLKYDDKYHLSKEQSSESEQKKCESGEQKCRSNEPYCECNEPYCEYNELSCGVNQQECQFNEKHCESSEQCRESSNAKGKLNGPSDGFNEQHIGCKVEYGDEANIEVKKQHVKENELEDKEHDIEDNEFAVKDKEQNIKETLSDIKDTEYSIATNVKDNELAVKDKEQNIIETLSDIKDAEHSIETNIKDNDYDIEETEPEVKDVEHGYGEIERDVKDKEHYIKENKPESTDLDDCCYGDDLLYNGPLAELYPRYNPVVSSISHNTCGDGSVACLASACLWSSQCKHLDTLDVLISRNCDLYLACFSDCFEKLKALTLLQFYMDNKAMLPLFNNVTSKLTSLSIIGGSISDYFIFPLIQNGTITELKLRECTEPASNELMLTLAKYQAANLQVLDLSWCEIEETNGIEELFCKCQKLKVVILQQMNLSTNALLHLCGSGDYLETLSVSNTEGVNDEILQAWATSFTHIIKLNISWNTDITDCGIEAILSNCLSLRVLNLSGLKRITSKPFLPIIANYPKFKTLLDESPKLPTINDNAENFKNEILEMEDAPFKCFSRNTAYAPLLRKLILEFCDLVTDEHLEQINEVCCGSLRIIDYYSSEVQPIFFVPHDFHED